jgi:hypothetical protein
MSALERLGRIGPAAKAAQDRQNQNRGALTLWSSRSFLCGRLVRQKPVSGETAPLSRSAPSPANSCRNVVNLSGPSNAADQKLMGALPKLMLAALLLAAFACSQAPPSIGPSLGQAVSEKPLPGNPESQNPPQLSPIEADAEVLRLQADFAHEVPHAILHSMSSDRIWIERVRAAIEASDWTIDRPQLLVVVDRNPSVEELRIMMVAQDGPWQVIGGSKVSTGEAGRRDYYITPVGVFLHTDAILDYRA